MRILIPATIMLLTGCNSHIPVSIKSAPEPDLSYLQVSENIKTNQDKIIRWGGKIISVENKEDSTWIEILSNPLNSYGKPVTNGSYNGRFIARVDGFLDKEQYKKDRRLTVYGRIETKLVRKIDEHPYNYPLVHASQHYLWPEYTSNRRIQMYPYGFYPYYHPFYYHPHRRFHSRFSHRYYMRYLHRW